MDFCRFWHGLAWKSALFWGKFHADHGISAAKATRHVATVLSVENSVVPNHGNPRKSEETAVAISTVIRGRFHGNAAITTEAHGSPRELPRQFPRTVNRSSFHCHPRPSAYFARRSSDTRQLPRKYVEVRGYCHSTCPGSVRGKFRGTNHAHGRPGPWP